MHGRRSLEPKLLPFEPKIDRLYRDIRFILSLEMSSQLLLGGQVPAIEEPPQLLYEFFIPKRYDRGAGVMGPQIAANYYEIKDSTINMLPSFHGLENEDLYLQVYIVTSIQGKEIKTNTQAKYLKQILTKTPLAFKAKESSSYTVESSSP
ncbi:unnamed protein product [Victoria cruziana]